MKSIREHWHKTLISICKTFGNSVSPRQTGAPSADIQLLPESLKLIPLLVNVTMKLPAFSMSRIQPDMRMYVAYLIKGMSISASQLLFYPRIYKLHDILEQPQQPGTLTQTQTVALPTLIPDTAESFSEDGVYLIYNGELLILYAGKTADEGFIHDVNQSQAFGVYREDLTSWRPTDLGTPESARVVAVIEEIRRIAQKYLPLIVVRSEMRGQLVAMMVEEATPSEMAYNEYLFQLSRILTSHRESK